MIRIKGGTDFSECATLLLVDDIGHEIEVIAELQDCSCKAGHVTVRLVDREVEARRKQSLQERIRADWTLVRRPHAPDA